MIPIPMKRRFCILHPPCEQTIGARRFTRPDTLPHAADRTQCGQVLISGLMLPSDQKSPPENVPEGRLAGSHNPRLCQPLDGNGDQFWNGSTYFSQYSCASSCARARSSLVMDSVTRSLFSLASSFP